MRNVELRLSKTPVAAGGAVSLAGLKNSIILAGMVVILLLLAVCIPASAVQAQKDTDRPVVVGNKDTKRYHLPGMPYYSKVAKYHRVYFNSEQEAVSKGYYKAGTGRDLPGAADRTGQTVKEQNTPAASAATSPEKAVVSAQEAPAAPASPAQNPVAVRATDQPASGLDRREESRPVPSEKRPAKAIAGRGAGKDEVREQKIPDRILPQYDLKSLYRQALSNSEKIKFAEENLYISQMGKSKAWAVLMPKVTAFGAYNRFSEEKYYNYTMVLPVPLPSISSSSLIQPNTVETWGVRAEQSFSLSIRELAALKIAGQTITKSEFDLDAAKTDFMLAVASAYYDVLRAKKGLEITAANMERLTQYRDSVEKRVKVGEVTRTALLRAEGELSGARADYVRATNALRLARAALVRVTGIEENFRLKEDDQPVPDVGRFERLQENAVTLRSDLKSFEMQKQIAEGQVKYARGAFWPNVSLFAVYNGADQNPPTQGLVRESVLAGVSLNFPFFEGGLRVAEYKEAKARERQARLAYDDLKKNIDIELRGSYLDLETQRGSLKFLEDQLAFAEDNYNAVLRQYENGLATSLDVMDANALLLTSERNLADALYSYQLGHLKVRKSSGTLLKFIQEGQ